MVVSQYQEVTPHGRRYCDTHMVVHDYICRIDEYSDRLPDCESPPVANAI